MARDVIITPASGLIDFQGSVGVSSATIELDSSGNLNIANPGGDLTLGDTSRDLYIGNGVANVDIIFEQDGEIRGLTGKTLTFGQSDSYISFAGDITSGLNVSGIVTALSFSGNASSATYATYAGIATYATTAGVSTSVSGGTASVTQLNVSGVSTFQGDVYLGDNDKIHLGDGNDLQIVHDGTNSRIRDNGTGQLLISTNGDRISLTKNSDDTSLARFIPDGSVELYYSGSKKFETTGVGVTVFGTLETQQLNVTGVSTFQGNVYLGDNDRIYFGDSIDSSIYHDGNNLFLLEGSGTGNLYIRGNSLQLQAPSNENYLIAYQNGAVELYYDNSKKFETISTGVTVTNDLYTSGNVSVAGTIFENFNGQLWNVVTQADVGYGASQVPLNQYLGQLAFLDDFSPNGLRRDGGGSDDVSVDTDGNVSIGGSIIVSGIVTATTFSGSGASLTSIPNGALDNSTVSYGGVTLSLGGSDATPAFDLQDATNYPTSSLVGTITNSQLAGSISNDKLVNSTVSYGGVTLSLGGSDATPAFNLQDATGLPISTGVAGLGANVATFLATPSSSNLAAAVTGETGSGALVFATSPTLVSPTLGNATATTINVSGVSTFQDNVSIAGTVGIGTRIDIVPYDTLSDGTLSFEGSAGQLFSITNNLTSGSIFSVNDISGIPSIDVDADGTIQLAPYGSTENVGIGTTNPTSKLDVVGDIKTTGDVSANSITATSASFSGNVSIAGTLTYEDVTNVDSLGIITARTGIQVLAGGINVSGVSTFQGNVYLGDNDKIVLGDGGDLEIFYNGTNSIIKQVTAGDLVLQSDDDIAIQVAGSENAIVCNGNGSVDIRHNNIKKFETTGYGATVYGTLQSQQANVSGIVTASAFYGDGSNLSDIVATNATNVIGGIASITSLNVSGISTLGTLKVSSGIVTATSGIITYYGDGSKLTGLTAQARVVASQTPPTSPTEGDLWYHTTVARLFVYFNDGDSNQWVDASPFNLTGSGGGTNVSVGATAPIAPIIGDLWYNSDYGRLFVYYQDEDSNQWVDAAPFNLPTNNEPAKTENSFIATPGQTTFTVSYEVGFVEVYLNGIRLSSGEFNASSGVSIILNDPATEGDVVDVIEIATGRGPTGPRGSGGPLENVTVATDNNTYYPIFAVGVGTTTPYINTTSGYLNYNPSSGTLNVNQLNVGVTTLGVTTATNLTVQSINCSGVATALDFNSTSDVNLKKDVKVIDDPVAKVLQLNGVSFNWTDTGQSSAGVIAQDVEKVMPEIIRDNPTGYKSLNYNGLIGLLIEAVKEQNETIKSLEQKINTLEERLS